MKSKRTIELTIERSEFWVLRRSRRFASDCCEVCPGRVQMLTPEEAAHRAGVSVRAIYQRIESGELHILEAPEGSLLICLDSLVRVG